MSTVARKKKCFEVKKGQISVGDPCYSCPGFVVDAQNGKWRAHVSTVDSFGRRVANIIVHHESFDPSRDVVTESHIIGVDSGQAGVFDGIYEGSDIDFYEECGSATLSNLGYGYIHNGFVTSSGYGDGGYEAVVFKRDDKAVCVEITFIADDYEEF